MLNRYMLSRFGEAPDFSDPPFVSVGADFEVTSLTFALSASSNYPGVWTKTSGPAATFVAPNELSTSVTVSAVGNYVFRFTATNPDTGDTAFDEVAVEVTLPTGSGDPPDLTSPSGPVVIRAQEGETATMSVEPARGDWSYEWWVHLNPQVPEPPLSEYIIVDSGSGYDTPVFTTSPRRTNIDHNKKYKCRVSNQYGEVWSHTFTLDMHGTTVPTQVNWHGAIADNAPIGEDSLPANLTRQIMLASAATGASWPWQRTWITPTFVWKRDVICDTEAEVTAAFANALDGDDIQIAGGEYTMTINNSKSFSGSQRVRVRAMDGQTVVLKCDNSLRTTLYNHNARGWIFGSILGNLVFDGNGYTHTVVAHGFYNGTKGSPGGSNPGPCHYMYYYNVEFRNSGYGCSRASYDSTNIYYMKCKMHDTGHLDPEYGEGIYIGSASGTADVTNGVYVWGTEFWDLTGEAVDMKDYSTGLDVDGCLMRDITFSSPKGWTQGAIAQRSRGTMVCRNTIITRVRNASNVTNSGQQPHGMYIIAGGTNTLENVVIVHCALAALRTQGSGTSIVAKHCTFGNNNNNAARSTVHKDSAPSVTLQACAYPSSTTVDGGTTITNCATWGSADFVGPLTSGGNGEGWLLSANSSLKGRVNRYVSTDLFGNPRPSTGAAIGAFEPLGGGGGVPNPAVAAGRTVVVIATGASTANITAPTIGSATFDQLMPPTGFSTAGIAVGIWKKTLTEEDIGIGVIDVGGWSATAGFLSNVGSFTIGTPQEGTGTSFNPNAFAVTANSIMLGLLSKQFEQVADVSAIGMDVGVNSNDGNNKRPASLFYKANSADGTVDPGTVTTSVSNGWLWVPMLVLPPGGGGSGGPGDDPILAFDFSAFSTTSYGNASSAQADFAAQAGPYFDSAYGMSEVRKNAEGNLEMRYRPETCNQGVSATAAIGVRLGRSATRFPGQQRGMYFHMRFKLKAPWDFSYQGGKLPGLASGVIPTGGSSEANGMSARHMFRPGTGGFGRLAAYVYHANRGTWGTDFLFMMSPGSGSAWPLPVDEWIDVWQYCLINTPGNSNGLLRGWTKLDNESGPTLRLDAGNFLWIASGATDGWYCDGAYISSFFGGNTCGRDEPAMTVYAEFAEIAIGPTPSSVGLAL